MVYINIFWHKDDVLVIRGYKDMISAMVDSNLVKDLIFDKSFALDKNKIEGTNTSVRKLIKQELKTIVDYKIVQSEIIEKLKVV